MRKSARSKLKARRRPKHGTEAEPRPGIRYGRDGFFMANRWPAILCPTCHDDRREPACRYCHGIGAILVLPFGPTPKRRPATKLTPSQVQMLRLVGLKLPAYPLEDTPEWTAFVDTYKSAISEKLSAIPKKPNLRRGRGPKKVITQDPMTETPE